MLQIPTYKKTQNDIIYSVAAALAGFMAGPFLLIPISNLIGRSSVILWSLIATMVCQIWAAEMTGANDYIPFVLSRLMYGLFGILPAILGSGYIMDMFFLHQRGKAFAVFEITIIFAVIGSGTFGGFIAQSRLWPYVFWWTVGPLVATMMLVFSFVEDTGFNRDPNTINRAPLQKNWIANRVATFLPGTQTVFGIGLHDLVSLPEYDLVYTSSNDEMINQASDTQCLHPICHPFTPIMLLVGTLVFIALDIPIIQASIQSIYLQTTIEASGYGFSPLQNAFCKQTHNPRIIVLFYLAHAKAPCFSQLV